MSGNISRLRDIYTVASLKIGYTRAHLAQSENIRIKGRMIQTKRFAAPALATNNCDDPGCHVGEH